MSGASAFIELDRIITLISKRRAHMRKMQLNPATDRALDVYYNSADREIQLLRIRGYLPRAL